MNSHDNRGRWIIIGGMLGATFGVSTHHLPLALALGIACGMSIGTLLNKMSHHHF